MIKNLKASVIHPSCVEVFCKIGRSNAEFVVYFSRRGIISGGYQFVPEEGYRYVDPVSDRDAKVLPDEVKTAAVNAYNGRHRG